MRFFCFGIGLLCFLFFSCNDRKSNSIRVDDSISESLDSSLILTMKKFGLADTSFQNDKTIIFYASRSFDTSFLLKLKYDQSAITGVYYEVLPTYHNNINSYADTSNGLLFFEGYHFKLEDAFWAEIVNKIEVIFATADTLKDNNGYRDGAVYGLYYNAAFMESSIKNASFFEHLYVFLKDLFLTDFILKRKPIMNKGSKKMKNYF